jgi:hypothetical protein
VGIGGATNRWWSSYAWKLWMDHGFVNRVSSSPCVCIFFFCLSSTHTPPSISGYNTMHRMMDPYVIAGLSGLREEATLPAGEPSCSSIYLNLCGRRPVCLAATYPCCMRYDNDRNERMRQRVKFVQDFRRHEGCATCVTSYGNQSRDSENLSPD